MSTITKKPTHGFRWFTAYLTDGEEEDVEVTVEYDFTPGDKWSGRESDYEPGREPEVTIRSVIRNDNGKALDVAGAELAELENEALIFATRK